MKISEPKQLRKKLEYFENVKDTRHIMYQVC